MTDLRLRQMLFILATCRVAHTIQRVYYGVGVILSNRNTELERRVGRGGASERKSKRQDIAGFVDNETSGEFHNRERSRDSERGKERQCKEASVDGHDA